ncbi:MAG TPA: PDZ domain-containing protein, partial [Pirellulales bacterium]|nr:PDZ domain-containing protein [Pirellulales bacterium]
MMKRTWIALTSILGLVSASALAQPILDRVEQQIRRAAVNPTEPGYLGVIANDRKDQGGEVRVLEVIAAGPAAKAGMQTDDLITSINGQPVRSMDEMARALERQPVGAKLTVTVTRQGADRQLEVVLGRRPQSRPTGRVPDELPSPLAPSADNAPPQGPRLGVQTLPVTDEARRQNGLP